MPSPMQKVAWEACLLRPRRDRALEAWLKREAGEAPGWSRYFWASPWFAKAMIRVGFHNGLLLRLDFELANLVALVVSQENSCRYCYAAARGMMRMLGLNEAGMQDLERRLGQVEFDTKTAAAVRFGRIVNRGHPLDGEAARDALRQAGFDDDEIRELAYVTVIMGFMNRLSTAVALPPQPWEGVPDNPFVRLFSPLVSAVLRRMMKHGRPETLPVPPPAVGGALIAFYRGSPIARVLAESLSEMWAADGLSRRSKVLMIATVAQGVDCPVCRQEVEALARAEGIAQQTLDDIVAHLDHPSLDEDDRRLLTLTRATLWYEPAILQKAARTLLDGIGEQKFIEALGVTTLANAYIRLTAALLPMT